VRIELFKRDFVDLGTNQQHTRVIDQHVELAIFLDGGGNARSRLRVDRHIPGERDSRSPIIQDGCHDIANWIAWQAVDDNLRSLARKLAADRLSDTGPASCDDCDFVV
jgi:hypothetical protein